MFCTIKLEAKQNAAELQDLPKSLIGLAQNHLNSSLQMYCLKVSIFL